MRLLSGLDDCESGSGMTETSYPFVQAHAPGWRVYVNQGDSR